MRWEYFVHTLDAGGTFSQGNVNPRELTDLLNWYGNQGWELISAFDTNSSGGTRLIVLTFKRSLGAEPAAPLSAR